MKGQGYVKGESERAKSVVVAEILALLSRPTEGSLSKGTHNVGIASQRGGGRGPIVLSPKHAKLAFKAHEAWTASTGKKREKNNKSEERKARMDRCKEMKSEREKKMKRRALPTLVPSPSVTGRFFPSSSVASAVFLFDTRISGAKDFRARVNDADDNTERAFVSTLSALAARETHTRSWPFSLPLFLPFSPSVSFSLFTLRLIEQRITRRIVQYRDAVEARTY